MNEYSVTSDIVEQARVYAAEKHKAVNHFYGEFPYEVHLEMVAGFAEKYIDLIPESKQNIVIAGCWVHDIIEDTRENYNDVKKALNEEVADLAYALTNEKGRSRQERANDKYYEGIRETPYAVFIKLCDRMANVAFSTTKGNPRMKDVYKRENDLFMAKIYDETYLLMFEDLKKMLA